MNKINLSEKLNQFSDHWNPRLLAEMNGQHIKVAKFQGAFVWHSHEDEDELFMVLKGSFTMEFRDRSIQLNEGEIIVVPKGVEHRPVAKEEVEVLLFESATTVNTGDADSDLKQSKLDKI
jgi:mannose-6-phosphate isomerase-like protein (cupin superfamily)